MMDTRGLVYVAPTNPEGGTTTYYEAWPVSKTAWAAMTTLARLADLCGQRDMGPLHLAGPSAAA